MADVGMRRKDRKPVLLFRQVETDNLKQLLGLGCPVFRVRAFLRGSCDKLFVC
jgi:hypothetical protein